ncbi:MAG: glutamate-1-semialdehyde 2,1-aminomutase [archaeon]|nr:glutamate-1-semialdehyde 2,1-aminomutase [archaeon]MCP8313390.1 glutamate-1-semialdehyde 2,1-aminomutase [archaeon]MCP8322545.1 glutamate-1-semialdehyde 2,1-aminomutase [archaeon]
MVESALSRARSYELFERAKKVLPGGVNSPVRAFEPYPFFVNRAKGSRIYSLDGDSFIDYCMAYGSLILGHSFEEVLNSVREQLAKGTLYGTPTALEVNFSEMISNLVPCMEMLRLVNSGTEATMHAIRLARGFTGRKKIIKFEGCFHGSHDYVLVKAGSGATSFGTPDSLGIPEESTLNTIVLPYNNFQVLEEVIRREGHDIAALIIEPVIGNAGLILPKDKYLNQIRKLTKDYGIILIFDEIITGFRLALGGAQEYYNIKPDITTLGKILGGGFPIAAFGGGREIMQYLSPSGKVYQAGTFSGNPISVTAGYSALQTLSKKQGKIYPKLEKNCEELKKALVDLASDYHVEAQVNKIASMFQIFFSPHSVIDYTSAKLSDTHKFHAYFQELLKHGVFIPPSQFETCFLSIAHSEEDLEKTINAFDSALHGVSIKSRSV